MIAIPALDLRDNACVQLVGGSYEQENVRIDDPVCVAIRFRDYGFRQLHLVDLDAATERGSNAEVVRQILSFDGLQVQVGGGIRTLGQITEALENGASRVIVGTRAVEDQSWLCVAASRYPGMIVVAADVRERQVVTHGWTQETPRSVLDVIDELNSLPIAGVLVTAVHREGMMNGTDLQLMSDVVDASVYPVYAAGGINGMSDLRSLAERGVSAAVIGMALYTGAIDPRMVAEEFAE